LNEAYDCWQDQPDSRFSSLCHARGFLPAMGDRHAWGRLPLLFSSALLCCCLSCQFSFEALTTRYPHGAPVWRDNNKSAASRPSPSFPFVRDRYTPAQVYTALDRVATRRSFHGEPYLPRVVGLAPPPFVMDREMPALSPAHTCNNTRVVFPLWRGG
jgi:hypothetical protein